MTGAAPLSIAMERRAFPEIRALAGQRRLEGYLASGRLAYDIADPLGKGRAKRLLQGEVLHLRDRTDDGLIGRSRLSRAGETVAGVAAANTFARGFLDRGGYPSGVLSYPGVMNAETKAEIQRGFAARHTGTQNVGRVLVLDNGLTPGPKTTLRHTARIGRLAPSNAWRWS